MSNVSLPAETTKEILTRGKAIERNFSTIRLNYAKFRQMYFMEWNTKPRNANVDANDWKITPSPSARNEVIGIKRLLDTSEVYVKVKEGQNTSKNSDKIERAMRQIVDASGDGRRARILSDATLAASLYGPVILTADFYADMMLGKMEPYKKRHIEKQMRKSPATIKVLNAEECSFEFDDGLLLCFQRTYKMRGSQIKSKYGELEGKPLKDGDEYIIRDIYTPENRVIEAEGYGTLMSRAHGLNCIPVAIGFSGGSELFYKPEEQINPFLYAKMKAELWERETSLLTAAFTNANMRGLLGPAFAVDPEGAPDKIVVEYVGGMRIVRAKATPLDDKIIDPVIFELLAKIDDMNGQSTIYRQTLGEDIDAGTFSGLAMLSSAGKLPLVDPQRALQQAFEDIFDYILYRIKQDGIENKLIEASDIPETYELEVSFDPKLPQDNLRNAQVASTIRGLVSQEWIQENLLQIGDSAAMRKQIAKEQIYQAILGNIVQNPEVMQGLVMQVMGQGKPAPQQPPPEAQPQPGQEQVPPEMMDPRGQPNMEQVPMTEPMVPPLERGPNGAQP